MGNYLNNTGTNLNSIDHIAVAVRSISEAVSVYETLGGIPGERETISEQEVEALCIEFRGVRIELLEPMSDRSPVSRFLKRNGPGLHHIAIAVEDIVNELEVAQAAGIVPIDLKPKLGAEGKLIAFLNPKSTGGVLIELTQSPNKFDSIE